MQPSWVSTTGVPLYLGSPSVLDHLLVKLTGTKLLSMHAKQLNTSWFSKLIILISGILVLLTAAATNYLVENCQYWTVWKFTVRGGGGGVGIGSSWSDHELAQHDVPWHAMMWWQVTMWHDKLWHNMTWQGILWHGRSLEESCQIQWIRMYAW